MDDHTTSRSVYHRVTNALTDDALLTTRVMMTVAIIHDAMGAMINGASGWSCAYSRSTRGSLANGFAVRLFSTGMGRVSVYQHQRCAGVRWQNSSADGGTGGGFGEYTPTTSLSLRPFGSQPRYKSGDYLSASVVVWVVWCLIVPLTIGPRCASVRAKLVLAEQLCCLPSVTTTRRVIVAVCGVTVLTNVLGEQGESF